MNRETLKIDLYGVLLGVVLVVLVGVMSGFFETDPFFGMSIMLLAILVVKLSYLVDLARKRSGRDPAGETTMANDRGE